MGIRPRRFVLDLDDEDANGIAEAQTPVGAGDLTLDGAAVVAGVAIFDFGRKVTLTSAGNDSVTTFIVTGTDSDGHAKVETLAGPNIETIEVPGYFATVTSINIDGAAVGELTAGFADGIASRTIPLDYISDVGAAIQVGVTGTIDYTIEETFGPVQDPDNPPSTLDWIAIAALATKTTDESGASTPGATAFRIKVNSYSSGAELAVSMAQPFTT